MVEGIAICGLILPDYLWVDDFAQRTCCHPSETAIRGCGMRGIRSEADVADRIHVRGRGQAAVIQTLAVHE